MDKIDYDYTLERIDEYIYYLEKSTPTENVIDMLNRMNTNRDIIKNMKRTKLIDKILNDTD